ncbi:MAG: hypothetical protein AAF298_05965 [Cyanobacteria bacterium P01_A01_bin.40]
MTQFKITKLSSDSLYNSIPQISGDNIVWISGLLGKATDIFLSNGREVIQLTNNDYFNRFPQISGNSVVWESLDLNSDSEIFLYDGKKIIQITNNDTNDSFPQVSGKNVVWYGASEFSRDNWFNSIEVFLYDGKEIIQLSDNNVPDLHPQVDGNKIVWQRVDLETNTTSIMLATLHQNESTLTPSSDRNYKIVTSSTIIILSLISLCFLKKLFFE